MAGKTENAVSKISLEEFIESAIDPETGENLVFNDEDKQTLVIAEQEILASFISISLALYKIKKSRLYLMRGCQSFTEYVANYWHQSRINAYRYISFAEKISRSDIFANQVKNLSQANAMFLANNLFEEIDSGEASVNEGKIVFADGREQDLEEYRKQFTASEKKLKKKVESLESKVKSMLTNSEDLQQKYIEQAHLVDQLSREKDIDPQILRYVKTKKEAIELTTNAAASILSTLMGVRKISEELLDDLEVVRSIRTLYNLVQEANRDLLNNYGELLYVEDVLNERKGIE